MDQLLCFIENLWQMSLSAAPWLLLGLLIGGLIKALVPMSFLHRHLAGNGLMPIVKAALLGAPLPLCSCGVIPVAVGLREAGASKPATVSFLVSTPETGIDSVAISYALLGPLMAVVRPITALFSALTAGVLVAKFGSKMDNNTIPAAEQNACCSSAAEPTVQEASCCDDKAEQGEKESLRVRLISGIHYAFTDLFGMLLFWLSIGIIFAAAVQTFLPATFLAEQGSGLTAMLVMVLIGIPMYICATASTPIAAGFMLAGVSPGTALVFLMAGPATNISTLGVIAKQLGRHSLLAYLTGVIVVAVLMGLGVDYFVQMMGLDIQSQLHAGQHLVPHSVALISFVILALSAIYNLRKGLAPVTKK